MNNQGFYFLDKYMDIPFVIMFLQTSVETVKITQKKDGQKC